MKIPQFGLDESSCILTEDGWVAIKDITPHHKIGTPRGYTRMMARTRCWVEDLELYPVEMCACPSFQVIFNHDLEHIYAVAFEDPDRPRFRYTGWLYNMILRNRGWVIMGEDYHLFPTLGTENPLTHTVEEENWPVKRILDKKEFDVVIDLDHVDPQY